MFQVNYNGFYDESELDYNARMSSDMFEIGMAGHEDYTYHANKTMERFNGYINKLMRELPDVSDDLKNRASVVMEQTRDNLDQVLNNQSATMASMSGGPVGMMMRSIMNQSTATSQRVMSQGRIARIQEIAQNDKLYYDVVNDRYSLIGQAQGRLGALINSVGATNANLAQVGMQSSIDATRALVGLRLGVADHLIKRSKLNYDWYTSVLNAETNMYRSHMDYMGQTFNSLATYEAARYDTDVRAMTDVFKSTAENNRHMLATAMTGFTGIYGHNIASRDRRLTAQQQLGTHIYGLHALGQIHQNQDRAKIIAAYAGQDAPLLANALKSVDSIDWLGQVQGGGNPIVDTLGIATGTLNYINNAFGDS